MIIFSTNIYESFYEFVETFHLSPLFPANYILFSRGLHRIGIIVPPSTIYLSIYVFGWKNGAERGKKEEEEKEKEKSFDSERVIYARLDARVDRDQASGLSRKRYSQGGSSGKIF